MPAKSKAQQKAAGAALSAKRGQTKKSGLKGASKSMVGSMDERELEDMASTKRKGKPEHAARLVMAAHDVGSLAGLADGELHQVEVDGEPVLLLKTNEGLHAVGGTCPHAGAPLMTGVRLGTRIICPWHKAVFCLRSGALLDPPAVDGLPAYQVRVADGRVLVGDKVVAERARSADKRRFVIVGAGAAGAVAAQTLRERGFGGEIIMLDRDNRVPYDRTILSKYVLSGGSAGEKSPLQSQAFYLEHGIERRTADVVRIDTGARRLLCADGSAVPFDAVLLASGAAPVAPGLTGADLGNVFTLRSVGDAQAILAQAERSRRAVVLGASFIGMEVAASLRERGLDVVVVGQETTPFAKQLGDAVGSAFVGLHKRQGVTFRLGHQVAELVGGPAVREVVLDDGERLPADLVVVGFGVRPATAFAKGLHLSEDGGLVVDRFLSAAPGIFAAGDIARFPLRADGPPIRVEHWRVAEQQGRLAARNMAGEHLPYDAVPVFWTIQYMKRLDYIGHAKDWDETVIHGDLEKPEFLVYYIKDGQVVAAAGMDRDRDTAALIELFTLRRDWTAAELGESPAGVLARPTV